MWVDLLSDSTFRFIITTSLTLLLGGISVWLAMRRPVQMPFTYETLFQQRVDPSNEEVRHGSNELDRSSPTERSSPVILSAAKDLAADRDRPFASLRVTRGDGST